MEANLGQFPFGQPVRVLKQQDRTPKKLFVLGVYASAVHARWKDRDGKKLAHALAVDSEPEIFWTGSGVDEIIARIQKERVPPELGTLEPADAEFNGPSGIALDEHYLHVLGFERSQVWLCDLIPHSCMNVKQQKAVERCYIQYVGKHGLQAASVPQRTAKLLDANRQKEILQEIEDCNPYVIMLLGNEPVRWFFKQSNDKRRKLSDFGDTPETYGKLHDIAIGTREYKILPLAHPRQAAKLGSYSQIWNDLHQDWRSSPQAEQIKERLHEQ